MTGTISFTAEEACEMAKDYLEKRGALPAYGKVISVSGSYSDIKAEIEVGSALQTEIMKEFDKAYPSNPPEGATS